MRKKLFTFLLALVTSVGLSWATTTDLASITDNYTAQDGEILTGTLGVSVKISIADGATVTLLNANINGDKTWTTGDYAGLTCLGDATITIVGTNSVSGFSVDDGYPGIYVPSGKTLIINGTGSLTAQSSTEEAAGIGARYNTHCGNIEIQSGKITAIASGEEGAGIGGAYNANCGNITISGGIVTAVGGYRGAGIGGGKRGNNDAGHCGNILISGGVVYATSGEEAAAIGGGRGGNNKNLSNCGTITITNTALKVYADQGGSSTNTIGAGKYNNCGTVTINGNTGVINADPYTFRTKEDGEIVVDYINAIGTVVYTQECKDKIDIARELYDALEDSQKALVTNDDYQKLLNAEAAYAALIPQPVVVTTHTLQLHVNDALMGSLALQNPSNDIVDNGDGTYTVPEGAEVTLHATPNDGYEFIGWKASSSICDFNECEFVDLPTTDNPLTVDMYMTAAFMAEFAAVAPQPQPAGNVVIWNMSMDAVNGIVDQNETKEVFGGITIAVGAKRAFMKNGNVNALLFAFSSNTQEGFKGFTFANTLGVNFKKIVLSGAAGTFDGKESTGWVINDDQSTITWEGDAASVSIWETLNFIGPIIVNEVEFTLEGGEPAPEGDGKLTGAFTINADGDQILFSKGNLQYQASTTTWRFATNQYDMIGADNANISDTYTGWIDLFGWGTGNNPTNTSTVDEDYPTFTDWGVNAISNGGNEANLWRTLTIQEWGYLIQTRTNAADLKGQATVADVHGFVLLPDSWTLPAGLSFTASPNNWTTNVYTAEQWAQMEAAGAVFLPATGYRNPDIVYVDEKGWYWSSNVYTDIVAYDFEFTETNSRVFGSRHYFGQPVRLVTAYDAPTPTPAVVIGDPNDASEVETFLSTYDGQTIDELIIDRPVLNNMYNTLCLPFDMNAAQIAASSLNGVEIREFTGASVEGTTLNLSVGDPVNAVVAGRPYFVKYSAASQLDDLHFEDVTIDNALLDNMAVTFDGVTFKGTFTPFVMPNGLNFQGGYLFLGQNNQLFWPNSSNPLKPFRAYFYVDVESSTPGNAPKYRGMPARIVEGKNVTTGVENAQSANQSTKVIVNGQLIIIKNDVRYNAQGQIVK